MLMGVFILVAAIACGVAAAMKGYWLLTGLFALIGIAVVTCR